MTNDDGVQKFLQSFCLVERFLSLSHGNSVPESGFSINRIVIEAYGYIINENKIVALRFVKDELLRVVVILNFNITKGLIGELKSSHLKYVQYMSEGKNKKKKRNKESYWKMKS